MKHLKIAICLVLIAMVFASCEKETTVEENSVEVNQNNLDPTGLSLSAEAISYNENFSKQSKNSTISAKIVDEETGLTFFNDAEEFQSNSCNDLALEDFETPRDFPGSYVLMYNNLDSTTNNAAFALGEIQENVFFYASGGGNGGDMAIMRGNFIRTLYTNDDYTIHYLNIGFTNDDVNFVSLDLLNLYGQIPMKIDIFGEETLIGSITVPNISMTPTFFGIKSEVPIKRISLNILAWGWEAIDNIRFGTCNDFDGDGVLNENDPHPNSDMSENLNIAGNNTSIQNKMVKNGSTMMDQLNDLIAQTNAQYNGENYDYLHKRFMTELSQLTYKWRMARLITSTQRTQISSIAWGATIPFYNYPV